MKKELKLTKKEQKLLINILCDGVDYREGLVDTYSNFSNKENPKKQHIKDVKEAEKFLNKVRESFGFAKPVDPFAGATLKTLQEIKEMFRSNRPFGGSDE